MEAIINEEDREDHILFEVDSYSKFACSKIFKNTNGGNVLGFHVFYIRLHGVPGVIGVDQVTCLTRTVIKTFA